MPRQAQDRPRPTTERAHAAVPINAENLLAQAQQDFDRGDLPAALVIARNATHGGAGSAAYILIGTIMMNGRRYDEAERAFTEAVRLDPGDPRASRLLAMVREVRKMEDGRQ